MGPRLGTDAADRMFSVWEANRLEPDDDTESFDDDREPEDDDREATPAEYDAMEGDY